MLCFKRIKQEKRSWRWALTSIYDVVDIGAAKTTIMEGRRAADGFTLQSVLTLVEYIGYEDNMNQVSWFPPETPEKKEFITDDVIMSKVVHYSIGSGAMMLFIVREDDPYMGRHLNMRGLLNDAEDEGDIGNESANEDNRVNDSSSSDSEIEERGGMIEQDDPFGVSDSEGGWFSS